MAVAVPPTWVMPTMARIAVGLVAWAVTVTVVPVTVMSPVTSAAARTAGRGGPGGGRVRGEPGGGGGAEGVVVEGVGAGAGGLLGGVGGRAVGGQRGPAVQHQPGQDDQRDRHDQQVGGDRSAIPIVAGAGSSGG